MRKFVRSIYLFFIMLMVGMAIPNSSTIAWAGAPQFIDRTDDLGLGNIGTGPACWVDFNNNGWPDLIANGRIFINNEGEGFTQIASGLGRVVAADFDNDGWVDLYSYSQGRLYRNLNGTGVEEVALPAFPEDHRSLGAAWGDFTGNGFVDLYIGGYENWDDGGGVTHADLLLANLDGTTFEIVWSNTENWYRARGVTACDFNQNGRLDVYVSNYRLMQNRLWRNEGNGVFTDVAPAYGAHGGGNSSGLFASAHTIGSAWADFDNDGLFDIFAGNFAHPWDSQPGDGGQQPESRFLRNRGPAAGYHFEDMGTGGIFYQESYATPVAGDLNNNGRVDLYMTTVYATASFGIPNHPALFQNTGYFSFTDVTAAAGVAGLPNTYQAALADYNGDGYLDLVTAGRLFENQGGSQRSLKVTLRGDGVGVNRSAIGAQARIRIGSETLTRQVEAGTGQGNQNDLTLHFGLGDHEDPVDVEITWPDGRVTWVQDIPADEQWIQVEQERLAIPYIQDFEGVPAERLATSLPGWSGDRHNKSRIIAHTTEYEHTRPLPPYEGTQALRIVPSAAPLTATFDMENGAEPHLYVDTLMRFGPYLRPYDIDEEDETVKLGLYLNEQSGLTLYHGGPDGESPTHTALPVTVETGRWYRITIHLDFDGAVEEGEPAGFPFFQARLDGTVLEHHDDGYPVPSGDHNDYGGGSWFRFAHHQAQTAAGTARRLTYLGLGGAGMLDDLVVSSTAPVFDTVFHRIWTVLGGNGQMDPPGSPVADPFPAREITVAAGEPVAITYTADPWHVIDELWSAGTEVSAAANATEYVWQVQHVTGDISNQVHFAEAIWPGDNRSPLWWADQVGYQDGGALSVYEGYLLNQLDLDQPFKLRASGTDEDQRPYAQWLSSGPPRGTVRGQASADLPDPEGWEWVDGASTHTDGTNTWTAATGAGEGAAFRLQVAE